MRISDFSRATGWSVDTIRFYEEKGLLSPSRDQSSRYRIYSQADLESAEGIEIGRALGFSLAEMRRLADEWKGAQMMPARKQQVIQQKLDQVQQKMDELCEIRTRLQNKLALIKSITERPAGPDSSPDEQSRV